MGIYQQLDIINASFCLLIDGVQHNIRASRRMGSERLDLSVGPIRMEIVKALKRLRLTVADNDSPVTADIVFTARHAPIEEPRFTRRNGPRMFMDYTRMTQSGNWSGTINHGRRDHAISGDTYFGTRDRSWGIRPIGAPEGALADFSAKTIGTGQMCDSFRLTLDWDGHDGPGCIIVKCPSANADSRHIAKTLHNYALEISWYRDLADEIPVTCPPCYHAEIADNEVDFALLLGDMTPAR